MPTIVRLQKDRGKLGRVEGRWAEVGRAESNEHSELQLLAAAALKLAQLPDELQYRTVYEVYE